MGRDGGHVRWRLGWLLDVDAQLRRIRKALTVAAPHDGRLLRGMARELRDARRCVRAQVGLEVDLEFLGRLKAVGSQWAGPVAQWLRGEPAGARRLHLEEQIALEAAMRVELGLPDLLATPATTTDPCLASVVGPDDHANDHADEDVRLGGSDEGGVPIALGRARDLRLALQRLGVARRLGLAAGSELVPVFAPARRGGGYVWLHLQGTGGGLERLLAFCRVRLVAWGQSPGCLPVGA